MKDIIKSLFLENWHYLAIAILTLLLFRNCQDNEKLQFANSVYKKDIKISQLQVDKYANRINALNDEIITLQGRKQSEKTKIVNVVKEVEKKILIAENLTTKGIANYYQGRYHLPVTITQYGVSLSDTIAKKNIVELVKKDGLVLKLNHTKNILNITEKQLNIKDGIIVLKDSIITENHKQIDSHIKQVKSERTKKTVWKIVSGSILVGAGFLLAR